MIDVSEADRYIRGNLMIPENKEVSIHDALGAIIAEDIFADRPFPPFNRATMDGIAIRFADFENGCRAFKVEGIIPTGSPTISLKGRDVCLEIMTGAVLPENADTIIPYEQIRIGEGVAHVDDILLKKGAAIHTKGRDCIEGNILIPKGRKITAVEIAILATVGKSFVSIFEKPKLVIIATGDELVGINEMPQSYQIRSSNVYMLQARLQEIGQESEIHHIKDDVKELKRKLDKLLSENDVLILSGGVSKGKFDFVPQVLEELGVRKIFHKVKQKPGKPFWFGRKGNKYIFALPGNPISSFLCLNRYFLNWYNTSFGQSHQYRASLSEDYVFSKSLVYFLQVKTYMNENAQLVAIPNTGNGSGDLANFSESTGFLELPKERSHFVKGELFPFYPFKNI